MQSEESTECRSLFVRKTGLEIAKLNDVAGKAAGGAFVSINE